MSPWPWVVVSLLGLMGLGALVAPILRKGCDHRNERALVITHAKMLNFALCNFRQDYGQYPCSGTVAMVRKNEPDATAPLGDRSSNELFRQLFVAGMIEDELPFFVPYVSRARPDNIVEGRQMLAAGECGFAYVVWEGVQDLPDSAPLLIAPARPGDKALDIRLINRVYGGKVIVMRVDGTVVLCPIDGKGRVIMPDGANLFDWSQPHWAGQKPKIAWPE